MTPIEGLLTLGVVFGGLCAALVLADVTLQLFPALEARLNRWLFGHDLDGGA